jgi:hypothetical protein
VEQFVRLAVPERGMDLQLKRSHKNPLCLQAKLGEQGLH